MYRRVQRFRTSYAFFGVNGVFWGVVVAPLWKLDVVEEATLEGCLPMASFASAGIIRSRGHFT
jgi:hypothetical protein